MPHRGPRGSYSTKKTVKNLKGEEVAIRVSHIEQSFFKSPDITKRAERGKLFEYLGVLMGRGSRKIEKGGHLIRRHSRIYGDLEGKYVKMHGELFGKKPEVHPRGRSGYDINIASMGTYDYLTKVLGFDPRSKTKGDILSKELAIHLLEDPNSRKALLKGFFHTHLTPMFKPDQSMGFMLSFEHVNPRMSEFITHLCDEEGIKTYAYEHRRFIMGKDSKLRALALLDNPYELGKLVAIVTERKGFGNIHIDPRQVGRRVRRADLENVPPELVQAGLLDKVEAHMKKNLLGRFTPRSQENFRKKIEARKLSVGKLPKKVRKRIKRAPKVKERRDIPPKKKRVFQSKGRKIDPEQRIEFLEKLRKRTPSTLKTHLTVINSNKGVLDKLIDYAAAYHPEKTELLGLLKEARSNKRKRDILKMVQENKRNRRR